MNTMTQATPTEGVKNDSKTFQTIFLASFVVLLAIAFVAQLLHQNWRSWFPGAEGERSLIGGVKACVYTFMSYLT
jgi:light-harvesting complex 1 beta chain